MLSSRLRSRLAELTPEELQIVIDAGTPRLPSKYVPHSPTPRQAAGLLCNQREVFYGGAAGGGKSDWLLMCALQYADVSGYAALLVRRTFAQLNQPGGLIPRSQEWLGHTDATWSEQKSRWLFPSGAVLQFGHLQREDDKYAHQSSEFQLVGFDELTHFSSSQYTYLFSRLRRLEGSGIPIRMRSGSNPGGRGHDWVKRRMIVEGREAGRIFIPARLEDNPHLDRDEYKASLMELDPTTRAQLLNGDWEAAPPGGFFKRQWFEIVPAVPANCRSIRGWDFAATAPKPGADPDWTVGARMSRSPEGIYYIHCEDYERFQCEPAALERRFVQRCQLDGSGVEAWIEQEPGSSGKIAAAALKNAARRCQGASVVHAQPSTGSKAVRAMPLASQAEAGNVKLVDGPEIAGLLERLESFAPDCAHDDDVDANSLAYSKLSNRRIGWGDLYPTREAG